MPEVRVGVAVIVRNPEGKVLMGLRCGLHGPGTWSLPGGNMDFGESPEETAKRELLEETGLVAIAIQVYERCPYANAPFPETGKQYITLYFEILAEGEPKRMEPDKCARWEWCDPKDLPQPLFAAMDQLDLAETKGMQPETVKVEFLLSKDQRLVMHYDQPVQWFALDTEEAREMASTLTSYADTIEGVEAS